MIRPCLRLSTTKMSGSQVILTSHFALLMLVHEHNMEGRFGQSNKRGRATLQSSSHFDFHRSMQGPVYTQGYMRSPPCNSLRPSTLPGKYPLLAHDPAALGDEALSELARAVIRSVLTRSALAQIAQTATVNGSPGQWKCTEIK